MMSRRSPNTLCASATSADPSTAPAPDALQIVVLGTGYVGLVSATCLASFGHQVAAIDIDQAKVDKLQRAEVTIHEAGLSEAVRRQLAAGRLRFACDPSDALAAADLVFIAVGTPARSDGSPCMLAIEQVTDRLQRTRLRPGAVIVIKSTVPVGTARRLQAELTGGCTGAVAPRVLGNPEFLREGSALHDFLHPDRIIIGCDDRSNDAGALLLRAYRPLVARNVPVLTMDTSSAELTKCAANAMLATRISFINEIAAIAAATGADIQQVCEGIGSDHRIGPQFLQAGVGYGGSCFPKDVAALRHAARERGVRTDILQATERVNGRQRAWAIDALQRDLGGSAALRGKRVAVWGLAFKPGTDDMREAPSLTLIECLVRAGVDVQLHDPVAMSNARERVPKDRRVHWADSPLAALQQADALILMTEWPAYLAIDPAVVAQALRLRLVYDGRNAFDLARWTAAGVRLVQVGRPECERRAAPQPTMVIHNLPTAQRAVPPHAALTAALR